MPNRGRSQGSPDALTMKLDGYLDCPVVAEWVRSRMAGSEHSTSKIPGLAERLLSGKRDDRYGHPRDLPLFRFIVGKQSVRFRFLKAASRH